ncbi:MAG: hypothetical protein JSR90_12545 [Proteobacteria bacterium]|nr:hypothetical protein [Pseudomonadota bacterium]
MLKQMLVQGLIAALVVGGAAAVYAQARENGYLSAPAQTQTGNPDKERSDGDRHARGDRDRRVHDHGTEARAASPGRDSDDD